MKKILVLCLALILALSLAACNPGGGNGGNTDTPSGTDSNSTPGTSQNGGGNDTGDWQASFASASGISGLPSFPDSDISYDKNNPRTVNFTAKSDITDEAFLAYAREVFDVSKTSSPDGIYDIDYEGFKKGAAVSGFPEENWSGMLMAYWYYTDNGYISQVYLSAKGNALAVTINDVYNTDTNERAKP